MKGNERKGKTAAMLPLRIEGAYHSFILWERERERNICRAFILRMFFAQEGTRYYSQDIAVTIERDSFRERCSKKIK